MLITLIVYLTPLTAMMSIEKRSTKVQNLKPLTVSVLSFTLSYMKGFSWRHIPLKVDVTEAENNLFAGGSVHLSAQKFYRLGQ